MWKEQLYKNSPKIQNYAYDKNQPHGQTKDNRLSMVFDQTKEDIPEMWGGIEILGNTQQNLSKLAANQSRYHHIS